MWPVGFSILDLDLGLDLDLTILFKRNKRTDTFHIAAVGQRDTGCVVLDYTVSDHEASE